MNEGKLRTYYALFITHVQTEKYLSVIKDVDVRKCFMSFRISLEQGRHRHKKLDAKERICKFCKSGTVEDEKQLLFNCSFYILLSEHHLSETAFFEISLF